MFDRIVAFPESRQLLILQLISAPFTTVYMSVMAMVPILLRDHFDAAIWQVAVATSAITLMFMLSVVWSEIYRRMSPHVYLWVIWFVAMVPLGVMALCHRPWQVLICVVISALGLAGLNPVNGDILRSCYPPRARSRVFSVIQIVGQATVMLTVYGIGVWLDADIEAFRVYMPISVLVIGFGLYLVHRMMSHRLFQERLRHEPTESLRSSLGNVFRNMLAVFGEDPTFRRFELAYFFYGLGFMTCHALMPFLIVDIWKLSYTDLAWATQSTLQIGMMVMILPAGYLMDRYGPVRMAMWGFLAVCLYPLGLVFVRTAPQAALMTLWFAVAMSPIHIAWTIGPVTLARNASQASHYLAIHATLVGPRTIVGQGVAVALYYLTGQVMIPLAGGTLALAVGALVMYRLSRDEARLARLKPAPPPVAPVPPRTP